MFLPLVVPIEIKETLDNLDKDDRETYVNNCIHAIIVLGQDRSTIKRPDLNRLVFLSNYSRTLPMAILIEANSRLNQIFGMRLFESEDKTRLILVNSLSEFSKYRNYSNHHEMAVLYFTLMDIFAAPDECKNEEELIDNLSDSLDTQEDIIRAYLDTFVKKNYLNLEKAQDMKNYSWGDRAIAEIDPNAFFEQFLDLIGDTTERDWPDLKKRVERLNRMANR